MDNKTRDAFRDLHAAFKGWQRHRTKVAAFTVLGVALAMVVALWIVWIQIADNVYSIEASLDRIEAHVNEIYQKAN